MYIQLGDVWFRVDVNRQRAHRHHDEIKFMKTRILAQTGTGAKGATHRCGKDIRRSNVGFHPTGGKSDRIKKSGSGSDKCGTQHSRNG
eukprot:13501474-Heterocapsa_arctica.AAC.1